MLWECIDALDIKSDGVYVDVTFGGGGHSKAILERLNEKGRLFAFDRDADAIKNEIKDTRLTVIRHNYRYLKNFLRYYNAIPVDGILADLGISSYQINEPSRGFSIRFNADLDMRMNTSHGIPLKDILLKLSETEIADLIWKYGEDRNSRRIARKIVDLRSKNQLPQNTSLLADAIASAFPPAAVCPRNPEAWALRSTLRPGAAAAPGRAVRKGPHAARPRRPTPATR